jgi:hypothetical protein
VNVAEILNKAADLIEKPGAWIQDAFSRDEHGFAEQGNGRWAAHPVCFCALGAIAQAAGMPDPEWAWATDAAKALESFVTEHRFCSVTDWNDAPERTQAEVVAALREAAKLAGAGS